jgi:cytosine permease
VLGTILGLGIYQHFMDWIEFLASIVPPLIGPVIAHFYVIEKMRFKPEMLDHAPSWNPAAIIAYLVGAAAAILNSKNILISSETMVPALTGLLVSIVVYIIAAYTGLSARRS